MVADTLPYPAAETMCADKSCGRPAWLSCPEGFCLFHSPYNGRLDAAARTVWETACGMAQAGDGDFRRWHFPPDPDLDLDRRQGGFFGATFSGDARFQGATFSGGAWFYGATFSGNAWFMGATFSGNAWFMGATFSGNALVRGATFSGYAGFRGATFERTADFDRAQFNADAFFVSARFAADARFNSSRFGPGGNVYFDTPRRRPLGLLGPNGDRSLWRAARVLAEATGRDALGFFRSTAEGDHTTAEYLLRVGARWPRFLAGPARPFLRRRGGESAYRFAKQAAQARGDYTEAGRYHYAERCAIEDRLMHEAGVGPRLHGLVRLLFGRAVFGYGERPWHPLLVGLAVILACTGLYLHVDAIGPGSAPGAEVLEPYAPTIGEALHFSVVTFTTLGYGDYQPKAAYRWLADAEAVLGAALLATFVVCLTRKYMR
jgi:hypothetical protein